jgi:hypothetical protein
MVYCCSPSPERIPALQNALTSTSTRLSPTLRRTWSTRAACSMVSNHASMSLQHLQILAAAEVVNLRERVVRAAVSAGTHMSRAGSPARRWAPGPVSAPPGRPGLPPLGIPSHRSLAPRFGIIRSRAGTGQNLRERKCPRVPGLGDTGLRDTLRQAQAGAPADCGHAAASQPVPRIIILTGQPVSGRARVTSPSSKSH